MTGGTRVYIGGPLTAPTRAEMQENARRAMRWMADLIRAGYTPFCPHLSLYCEWMLEEEEGQGIAYETWMSYDFRWLHACDVFLYLGHSPGADRELALAREIGMPVILADRQTQAECETLLRARDEMMRT